MPIKPNLPLTIKNQFHGFQIETKSKNPATLRKYINSLKAEECLSETRITDADGDELQIVNIGKGDVLKWR